jgi:hypothetical protein
VIPIESRDAARSVRFDADSAHFLDEEGRPVLVDGRPLVFVPDAEDVRGVRRILEAALGEPGGQSASLSELLSIRRSRADGVLSAFRAHLGGRPAGRHVSVVKDVGVFPWDAARPEIFDGYAEHYLLTILEIASVSELRGRVSTRFEGDPERIERLWATPAAAELLERGLLTRETPAPSDGTPVSEIRLSGIQVAPVEGRAFLPEAPLVAGDVSQDKAHVLLAVFGAIIGEATPPDTFVSAYRSLLGEAGDDLDAAKAAHFLRGEASKARVYAARFALRAVQRVDWHRALGFFENAKRMVLGSA